MKIGKVLPKSFFARETELVARELLGKVLEADTGAGKCAGIIVETEAYVGEHDLACHAAVGRTRRTETLYGEPGRAYVYLIYGMYWCINSVTRQKGCPSGVLIRAIEPVIGVELMRARRPKVRNDHRLTDGPGKLCIALGIDGAFNGSSLQTGPVRIREGKVFSDREVAITPRIGISKAVDWPLRWIVKSNPYVSR